MIRSALTVAQLLNLNRSTVSFSDEAATEKLDCLLFTGKSEREAAEVPYKIIGFSSGVNYTRLEEPIQVEVFTHGRPDQPILFKLDLPASFVRRASEFLKFSIHPKFLAKKFSPYPLKGKIFEIPKSHSEAKLKSEQILKMHHHGRNKIVKFVFNHKLCDGPIYSGSLDKYDLPHGDGSIQFPNGDSYEGEFRRGQIYGLGSYLSNEGDSIEGLVDEIKLFALFTNPSNTDLFYGTCKNGKFESLCWWVFSSGWQYLGHLTNGLQNGSGIEVRPHGLIYMGGFKNNKFDGKCLLMLPDKSICEGRFKNGVYYALKPVDDNKSAAKSIRDNRDASLPTTDSGIFEIDKMTINEDCSICFKKLTPAVRIKKLGCKHVFHEECVVSWLLERQTCPICRFNIFTNKPATD